MAKYSISSHNAEGLPVCWATLWWGTLFTIARLRQTLHDEGLSTVRLCALRYSGCKLLLSFSLLSRCTPNYTCGELHRHAFLALLQRWVFHLLPLTLFLLHFSNSVYLTVRDLNSYFLLPLSSSCSSFSSSTLKCNDHSWSWSDKKMASKRAKSTWQPFFTAYCGGK